MEYDRKRDISIHKQNWKLRQKFESEIGAQNVIYTLIDTVSKLLYVGKAKDLIKRFKQDHDRISNWNYYRYNALPIELENYRVIIERMVIRDYASIFNNLKELETLSLSDYTLINEKIDK